MKSSIVCQKSLKPLLCQGKMEEFKSVEEFFLNYSVGRLVQSKIICLKDFNLIVKFNSNGK